jgi:hypothetical protein
MSLAMPASPYAIAAGDQIVIYNLGSGRWRGRILAVTVLP